MDMLFVLRLEHAERDEANNTTIKRMNPNLWDRMFVTVRN